MKFIHGHWDTKELLRTWAGESQLILASHFFRINGNDIQKSQNGLLREMCADVARQCPQIFLERWKQMQINSREFRSESTSRVEWSNSSLRQLLEVVQDSDLRVEGRSVRFAFFIDGLDEYSGDHSSLRHSNIYALPRTSRSAQPAGLRMSSRGLLAATIGRSCTCND